MTFTPPSSHAEQHFRIYEIPLAEVVRNFPAVSYLSTAGSASTLRQNLRKALHIYVENKTIHSPIDREVATKLFSTFTFGETTDGRVYIGPRRTSTSIKQVAVTSQQEPDLLSTLAPIDCSDFEVFRAVLTLKNSDAINIPLRLTSVSPAHADLAIQTFLNIELIPGENPGDYTVL